jgi:hypothetical protein
MESLDGASLRSCGFLVSILGWRICLQRAKKTRRGTSYLIDRSAERDFVRFGRLGKTADFSHELKRSRSNILGAHRRLEVEESLYIPAHFKNASTGRCNFLARFW